MLRDNILNYKCMSEQVAEFCGEKVLVVGMTTAERNIVLSPAIGRDGRIDMVKLLENEGRVIIQCVRDPENRDRQVFTKADYDFIMKLPPSQTDPVFRLAIALSGEDAELVDVARKNSNQGANS